MKNKFCYLTLAAALAASPLAFAVDPQSPGKASDGVKEPAKSPSAAGATESARPAARTGAPATEPGKESDGVKEPKAKANRFNGKITAVNESAKTVTVDDKTMGSHTLHIGATTKVMKGKEEAGWADLKVGDEVHGTCMKDGEQFHAEKLMLPK